MTKQVTTCGSCKHYDLDRRFCRKDPPVVQDNRTAFWPRTNFDDWCGRWEDRVKD